MERRTPATDVNGTSASAAHGETSKRVGETGLDELRGLSLERESPSPSKSRPSSSENEPMPLDLNPLELRPSSSQHPNLTPVAEMSVEEDMDEAVFAEDVDVDKFASLDDTDEEPEETTAMRLEQLPQSHPLLQRVQTALERQLQRELAELDEALFHEREAIKKLHAEREEIGVDLYAQQQQLAKAQLKLQKQFEDIEDELHLKTEAEVRLERVRETQDEARKKLEKLQQRLVHKREEHTSLATTVRALDEQYRSIQANIVGKQQQTLAAEDELLDEEKRKVRQDALLLSLQQKQLLVNEKREIIAQQTHEQQRQLELAKAAVKDTQQEVQEQERQLAEFSARWFAALKQISKRDAALVATKEEYKKTQDQAAELHAEGLALKKEVASSQNAREKQHSSNTELKSRLEELDANLATMRTEAERMQEQRTAVVKDKERAMKRLTKLKNQWQTHQSRQIAIEKKRDSARERLRVAERKISEILSTNVTLEQDAAGSVHEISRLQETIRNINHEINVLEHSVAESKLAGLEIESQVMKARKKREEASNRAAAQEELVDELEAAWDKINEEITKKQLLVDKLNRKLDQLTQHQAATEESAAAMLGPLEATIANLQREITQQNQELMASQLRWTALQNSLISETKQHDELVAELDSIELQKVVLRQKLVRIEGVMEERKKALKAQRLQEQNLRNDMSKLHNAIDKFQKLSDKLEADKTASEATFQASIQAVDEEALETNTRTLKLREEREDIFEQLIELERQILQWQRKIDLEKETQKMMDPEFGQVEVRQMKQEIRRMELRLRQLNRRQQQMVADMERTVEKRELIALKHGAGLATDGSGILGTASAAAHESMTRGEDNGDDVGGPVTESHVLARTRKLMECTDELRARLRKALAKLRERRDEEGSLKIILSEEEAQRHRASLQLREMRHSFVQATTNADIVRLQCSLILQACQRVRRRAEIGAAESDDKLRLSTKQLNELVQRQRQSMSELAETIAQALKQCHTLRCAEEIDDDRAAELERLIAALEAFKTMLLLEE
ncbi:MAG: hypothetical protein MHM6MM_001622 [Cercozoa sp. M6MM]